MVSGSFDFQLSRFIFALEIVLQRHHKAARGLSFKCLYRGEISLEVSYRASRSLTGHGRDLTISSN